MRLKSLDALRGIAALVVVFYHALIILPTGGDDRNAFLAHGFKAPMAWLYLSPLRLLVAGPAAVMVFFVLSGLVLSLSFLDHDRVQYLPFALKRITRIWLPFAAVILVAALLTQVIPLQAVPGTSAWFQTSWTQPATWHALRDHLLLTGTFMDLDRPMWSLVYELRVSLVFPVLVGLMLWNWRATLAGGLVLSVVCVKISHGGHMDGDAWSPLSSLLATGCYIFLFVLGILLAQHLRALQAYVEKQTGRVQIGLWGLGLAGLCLTPERTDIIFLFHDDGAMMVSGAAAALMILLCSIDGPVYRFLLKRLPTFLGRISYSLYLIHMVVLELVLHLGAGWAPLPVLIGAGIMLSLALADVCQRTIEVPTMELGRRLARRWTSPGVHRPDPRLEALDPKTTGPTLRGGRGGELSALGRTGVDLA